MRSTSPIQISVSDALVFEDVEIVQPLDTALLYPDSMAVDETGQIWIGVRHYVVRLAPAGARYTVAWLVRDPSV